MTAPYEVKEQGYAGFLIPIKINFKNGIHADLTYDLYLYNGRDLESRRIEKLTFNNPSDKFRKQLIGGGGYPKKRSPRRSPPLLSEIPKTNFPKKHRSNNPDAIRERKNEKLKVKMRDGDSAIKRTAPIAPAARKEPPPEPPVVKDRVPASVFFVKFNPLRIVFSFNRPGRIWLKSNGKLLARPAKIKDGPV